jgi:hypothetical protein
MSSDNAMSLGVHDHPMYRPLWVRLALVAVTIGWVAFELTYGGSGLWTILSIATCAYAVWTFLITYKPGTDPPNGT